MMKLFHAILVCLLLAQGCAHPVNQRPSAGDQVTPEIILEEPWQAGSKAQVTIRLFLIRKDHPQPAFVQFDDVPHEVEAKADLVFWKDQEELERRDGLILARNC